MDLQTVLDWYRSALLAVMPGITGWRVEQGVYWLPISAGVGLCATSDGTRTQVELCRGLSGESLLSIEHGRGAPFHIRDAATWIKECVGRLVRETEEVLQAFGAELPLQLGSPMNAAIPIPAEVRIVQQPADASGWDLHRSPLFYETTVDDLGDLATRAALKEDVDAVLVAGGDGTVRAVAEALTSTGIPLTIVPSGTGNLLARNLNLPLDDADAMIRAALSNGGVDNITVILLRCYAT